MNEFTKEVELILQVEPGTLTPESLLSDNGWDSMATVMFIAMADEKYAKQIAGDSVFKAKTIIDLFQLIS